MVRHWICSLVLSSLLLVTVVVVSFFSTRSASNSRRRRLRRRATTERIVFYNHWSYNNSNSNSQIINYSFGWSILRLKHGLLLLVLVIILLLLGGHSYQTQGFVVHTVPLQQQQRPKYFSPRKNLVNHFSYSRLTFTTSRRTTYHNHNYNYYGWMKLLCYSNRPQTSTFLQLQLQRLPIQQQQQLLARRRIFIAIGPTTLTTSTTSAFRRNQRQWSHNYHHYDCTFHSLSLSSAMRSTDTISTIDDNNNNNDEKHNILLYNNISSIIRRTNCTINNNSNEYYSLEHLQHRVSLFVQRQQQQQQQQQQIDVDQNISNNHNKKVCFAIAGGGGHLVSTLAATPGASSILLEATLPYSREAFQQYISTQFSTSNSTTASRNSNSNYNSTTATINTATSDDDNNNTTTATFKYCSDVAAQRLANAAYLRALQLTAAAVTESTTTVPATTATTTTTNWTNIYRSVMGVASTSVLQSTIYNTTTTTGSDDNGSPIRQQKSTRRSVETFGSRAYCAVQTSSGLQVQLHVQLARVQPSTKNAITTGSSDAVPEDIIHRRTRLDEDVLVSHYLLSCMELYHYANNYDDVIQMLGIIESDDNVIQTIDSSSNNNDAVVIKGMTLHGDVLTMSISPSLLATNAKTLTATTTRKSESDSSTTDEPVIVDDPLRRAAERVLSGQDEVVMILLPNSNNISNSSNNNTTIEVQDVTILPPQSLVVPGSFNPIHVGHVALALAAAGAMSSKCNAIFFELSITNVDKPALAIDTIIERIKYFFPLRNDIPDDICWGILLTNAPLFKQKVDLLAPLQLKSSTTANDTILHFSIGTDTLVRLIDPKYYNNSEEEMLQTLNEMSCHFVVGGRLDQTKKQKMNDDDNNNDSIFIAGDEVIETLPMTIHNKFTILPDFRIDLSSTEIRQQMEAEKERT